MRIQAGERPTTTTHARAKVNLALSVGPPRDGDGMHPIASWMARLDLADELTLTRLDDGDLSRYAILWHEEAVRPTDIDWSITKDLAVRAHLALQEHLGRELPVQVKLEKRIPVGGGLGGGSADAAAMLRALDELFSLDLDHDTLVGIASGLGSDVAYCLLDGPAVVEGLGESLEPTPALSGDVLLIVPPFGCGTGAVYRAYDESPGALREDEVRAMARSGTVDGAALFNDLADPARRVSPALDALLERLGAIAGDGPRVHVTGSGSTCFAYASADERAGLFALADAIEDQLEDVRVLVCSLS
ncbi:MAG: 4-(cytidine 5'-diphospho)-2-C-methyl-D-erythritol kinase [Phycisphaerales bacterium]